MKTVLQSENGKGLIPILILVVVAAVVAVLFLSKGNLTTSPVPDTNSTNNSNPGAGNQQAKGPVSLVLDPSIATTTANQTFVVNVKVDTQTETVAAAELHLSYDPAYLEVTSLKAGALLPVVLSPAKITAGTASIAVGTSPTDPQKGSGTIATVTFKAKKGGKTEVTIDKTTQVAALDRTGSVLSSTSGTSVIIK